MEWKKLSEVKDGEVYMVGDIGFKKGEDREPKLHPLELVALLPMYCILVKHTKDSDWEQSGRSNWEREYLEAIVKAEVNNHMIFTGQVVNNSTGETVYWI